MTAITIDSHGDASNSPQRTVSGYYLPQAVNAQYSFVRILDGVGGAYYVIGQVQPDIKSGRWSVGVTLGGMTPSPTPGGGFMPGSEGVHSIVAQAVAPSGALLEASTPVQYTLKREAPVLTFNPVAPGTSNPAISVSGTIDFADYQLPVSIFDNGISLHQVSAGSDGKWNASITLSGAGNHSLSAAATDVVGNRGQTPAVVTLLSPAPPTLSITGAGPTPRGMYLISGNIDRNDVSQPISIFDGTTLVDTVLSQNVRTDGTWTTFLALSAGSHSLTAKATNPAGTGVSAIVPVQVAP